MTSKKEVIKALKISDIVIDDITVGTKKVNKVVSIKLNNSSLVFQTPYIEITGGLKETSYPGLYQINTQFKGDDQQKVKDFYYFIEYLEKKITEQIEVYGAKWFTDKKVIIKSLIHENENKGLFYSRWAIDLKNNIFIDKDKKPFDYKNIKEKDQIKMIIEISSLWINGNECGLAAIVHKIMVKSYVEKVQNEYEFDESESSDNDNSKNNIISLLATEQIKPQTKINSNVKNQNKSSMQTNHVNKAGQIEQSKYIDKINKTSKAISDVIKTPSPSRSKNTFSDSDFSDSNEISIGNDIDYLSGDEINEDDLDFKY